MFVYTVQVGDNMRTESQKKADKKYRNKKLSDGTKKQINATLDISDYNMIDEYCETNNVSKAKFLVATCKYCIDNNVDLSEYLDDK